MHFTWRLTYSHPTFLLEMNDHKPSPLSWRAPKGAMCDLLVQCLCPSTVGLPVGACRLTWGRAALKEALKFNTIERAHENYQKHCLCAIFFNDSCWLSLLVSVFKSCTILFFRCNLASLLTIALHGKLEYYTSIMKDLLVDLIDASASKNPKLMLRRTESVVEKMLTNWMSICMYSYLRVR